MDYREGALRLLNSTAALNRLMARSRLQEFWKGEIHVLLFLSDRESSTPGELSGVMGISTARVAAMLNAMEEKGLILRQISPKDRRKIVVTLTAQGRERVQARQEQLLRDTQAMLMELGEHDATEYLRIIGRLIGLMEAHTQDANQQRK